MIIDAWIQHPTANFVGHPMFESLRRWMGMEETPSAIPLSMTLAILDGASIDRALVSAWVGPSGNLISNDEVASFVAEAPDRLIGVGSVDLNSPVKAVEEVRRCARELGFRAIRVLPWLWNAPPDDRRYYPIYVACVEEGLPFCLQSGHTGPMCPSEPGRPIPYLDTVALDFPELTIVAGHVGFPWHDELISMATKYENVYIDTSAYKLSRLPESLVRYMRGHGRRKVLFGSNYPMITPAACLAGLDNLELGDEAKDSFLWGNAARVFGLEHDTTPESASGL